MCRILSIWFSTQKGTLMNALLCKGIHLVFYKVWGIPKGFMGFEISLYVFIFFSFFLSFPFNLISRLPLSSYFKLIYFLYFIPLFIILDLVKPWFYLPIYNFFASFLILCLYAFCFMEDGHKFYLKCIWLQILTQL
jgi:hypothetical protein